MTEKKPRFEIVEGIGGKFMLDDLDDGGAQIAQNLDARTARLFAAAEETKAQRDECVAMLRRVKDTVAEYATENCDCECPDWPCPLCNESMQLHDLLARIEGE